MGENIRTGFKIGFEVVELNGSELGSVTIWKEQCDGNFDVHKTGHISDQMKKYYLESRSRGISCMK